MSKERTPAQPEAVKISYLFELAGSKKTGLYIAVIFSVLSGLCTFVPYLMIFSTVLFLFDGNGNSTEAMRYGLIAAAFILLRFIFQAISVTLTHYGAYSALYAVRKKICEHIGKVNLGFFTDNSTGEIKKVLMEDVERLEQFLAHQVPDITVAIVVPLTVFVYLLTVNIPMALILAVPIILTLVLQSIMMVLVTPKMQDFSVVQGQLNSALLQFVNGMPVMKAYNLTANSYQAYSKAGEDFNVLWKQISRMAAPISAVCKVLIESGVSFTLPMGGFLYLAGYLDLSSYVFFVIMSIVFLSSYNNLNDKQQVRLRKEFEKYPQLYYSGGRRDSTRVRNKEVFDPYLVAQTLLAFHGDCVTAYNSKKLIWDEDKEYTNIFSDQLTAEHIIFVYSLGRAIDEFKINLKNKKEQRTDIEDDELNFLSKRGSKMLLISAVSTCMESLLGKKILDSWRLVFKDNKNFDKLVEEWKAILDVLMPWHSTLEPAIVSGLKSKEATQNAAKQLRATLTSFSSMYAQQLKPFSDSINTDM